MVFSVLYSCKKPKTAFTKTIKTMVSASTASPISTDITVAPSKIITMKSLNWPAKIFAGWTAFLCDRMFSPYFASLFSASAEESPDTSESSRPALAIFILPIFSAFDSSSIDIYSKPVPFIPLRRPAKCVKWNQHKKERFYEMDSHFRSAHRQTDQ